MTPDLVPARKNVAFWLFMITLGAGIALWFGNSHAPAVEPGAVPAIPVEIAIAKRTDVPLYFQGLGSVQAFNTAAVTTRVDGQIRSINFSDGQEVKVGEVLAQIDPRLYRAAYDQAVASKAKDEASFANAQIDMHRYQVLASQNAIAMQMLDTQRATVAQLKAQIEVDQAAIDSAKTNLDYATIRSPINGRAGIRQIDMGNNLTTSANTTLVIVTQLQPISVIFSLPEEDLADVTSGLAAGGLTAVALSRDNKTELDRGSTIVLDNEVNPTNGTLKLKATFPNAQKKLWPGDFVNVKLLVRTDKNALTVPAGAIQRGPNGQFVYVVGRDATVAIRPISLKRLENGTADILSGLQAGEIVVTTGQYRLQSGARVQIPITARVGPGATKPLRLSPK